jgi:hypothetical protein
VGTVSLVLRDDKLRKSPHITYTCRETQSHRVSFNNMLSVVIYFLPVSRYQGLPIVLWRKLSPRNDPSFALAGSTIRIWPCTDRTRLASLAHICRGGDAAYAPVVLGRAIQLSPEIETNVGELRATLSPLEDFYIEHPRSASSSSSS